MTKLLPTYELPRKLFDSGVGLLGSLDEAGRGPLAGPVVAACVICDSKFLPSQKLVSGVKDSKQLSAKQRDYLYELIMEEFPAVGVGYCDQATIDRINILEASFLAMKKALGMLKQKPDYIILDGKFILPNISYKQSAIVKGDALVFTIAAASIVAKVTRDRIMIKAHADYPNYGFDQHKGYGTRIHMKALQEFGPCPLHRRSFAPVKKYSRQ